MLSRLLPIKGHQVAADLAEADGREGCSPAIEFGPLAVQEDQDRALQHLLDLPEQFGRERQRQVVVILDEFQEFVTLDPALPAMFRATLQVQEHVAYAFLGSRKHLMTRVFTDRNEPLYRSARALPLGPISGVDFAAFISRTFESTEVWIEDDAIERILTITDGHPHDTQELAHLAWERGVEPSMVVTTPDVEAALLDVVEAEDAHYTTLWESLSRTQRPLVQARATEPTATPYAEPFRSRHQLGSAAMVQRSLHAVMEHDVVNASSIHGYRVPHVFLRHLDRGDAGQRSGHSQAFSAGDCNSHRSSNRRRPLARRPAITPAGGTSCAPS